MIRQFIVDAFTDKLFSGNPAAVCIVDRFPSDELMLSIAKENNLSETAFVVALPDPHHYHLRWFTPGAEVDLCGHATLASGFAVLNYIDKDASQVSFETLSGTLVVTRSDDLYELDFPAYDLTPVPVTEQMTEAFGYSPVEAYIGRDLLCVFEDEKQILSMDPDQELLMNLDGLLQHVTAPGKGTDCVSRSFAPKIAIAEDPVCGSGHCHIAPYWFKRLNANHIVAYQASQRGGTLHCRLEDDRIILAGNAILFSKGDLNIDL